MSEKIRSNNIKGDLLFDIVSKIFANFTKWSENTFLLRNAAFFLSITSVLFAGITYFVLTDADFLRSHPKGTQGILIADLTLLLALGILVFRKLVTIWISRKREFSGSRIHVRLVLTLALLTATPAVLVAIFSILIFNMGIQGWFSEQIRNTLEESQIVAQSYLKEHQNNARSHIIALARDLRSEGSAIYQNPRYMNNIIAAHATLRSLSEIIIFERSGKLLAKAGDSFLIEFEGAPPSWAFNAAGNGEIAIWTTDQGDRVRALIELDRNRNVFLYVGRMVDKEVLKHMSRHQNIYNFYKRLEENKSILQITFVLVYILVSLLLLLAAVWAGIIFASRLTEPISAIIDVSEKVRGGDLSVRLKKLSDKKDDELGRLGTTFNKMISRLSRQRASLVNSYEQLDIRRRFTETVLGGVSSGVISLNSKLEINLINPFALDLLGIELKKSIGKKISTILPDLKSLIEELSKAKKGFVEKAIELTRNRRLTRILLRITVDKKDNNILGYILTFSDVSELVLAQRKAAWSDIARKIAHEIKNPLTPIQLSTEQLKRKYSKQIKSDLKTFKLCTDTITRQVRFIADMVDEFSSFARMREPVLKRENLTEISKQQVFLHDRVYKNISCEFHSDDLKIMGFVDAQLVSQALTNLIKNSAESILRKYKNNETSKGKISVSLEEDKNQITLTVSDNGEGISSKIRPHLTDPYFTTHPTGTGLGLAIVKRVIDGHQGYITFENGKKGGTKVVLTIPVKQDISMKTKTSRTTEMQ